MWGICFEGKPCHKTTTTTKNLLEMAHGWGKLLLKAVTEKEYNLQHFKRKPFTTTLIRDAGNLVFSSMFLRSRVTKC